MILRALLPIPFLLALTACGTTGSNPPPPNPIEPTVPAALAQGLQLTGQSISGQIVEVNGENQFQNGQVAPVDVTFFQAPGSTLFTATVGGENFILASIPTESDNENISGYLLNNFTEANPNPPPGEPHIWGLFANANHSAVSLLHQYDEIDDVTTDVFSTATYGGVETPVDAMPSQLASYDGTWILNSAQGIVPSGFPGFLSDSGIFEATSDFDNNQIAFMVYNYNDQEVGLGQGIIAGNTFESSFAVQFGPGQSQNTVTGGFFGPAAQEIAGSITGQTGAGAQTTGVLIGTAQ